MRISSAAAQRIHNGIYGILGHEISYSLSPWLFRQVFDHLQWSAVFARCDLPTAQLRGFLRACGDAGIVGLSVTKPYKVRVLEHLDRVTPPAQRIGAVNTIAVVRGRLVGHNTDVAGIVATLWPHRRGLLGRNAVILGAGGAARAVAAALEHTFRMAQIAVLSRSPRNAQRTWRNLVTTSGSKCHLDFVPWHSNEMRARLQDAALLVNATPLGTWGSRSQSPLPRGVTIPSDAIVFDLVYRPRLTRLLSQAQKSGCRAALGGWPMLIAQADAAFNIWTGQPFPAALHRRLLRDAP
ncbi:MAG: hypothetical protein HY304_09510 [candidate division Zixibacteria bacterium]|nr:hypothetical protein [candidate division Zixibacteria bacterium]